MSSADESTGVAISDSCRQAATQVDPARPWRCPRCRAELARGDTGLRCVACQSSYEEIDGIVDLRVAGDSWIEFSEDRASARELAALDLPLDQLVRAVYSRRAGLDPGWIERRVAQILAAPVQLGDELGGWLKPAIAKGISLDLGCGGGGLLAAAARQGHASIGIGIDVSMTWLVVAKRVILAHGGTPVLAAALGEALPLADGVLDAVISLDVVEHVSNPQLYLREIDRVTAPRGHLALSTPNRLSLTAEPHVYVWGVGWLPLAYQARFVRWRSGKSYENTRLLSSFGLSRLLRRCTCFDFDVLIPTVPAPHIALFSPAKAWLAGLYNRLCSSRLLRGLFLVIAPFFRVTGLKRGSPSIQ